MPSVKGAGSWSWPKADKTSALVVGVSRTATIDTPFTPEARVIVRGELADGTPITYSQLMRHVIKAKIHTVVLSTLTPMTGPRP